MAGTDRWAFAGVDDLAGAMASGQLSAEALVAACRRRIALLDRGGPHIGAVVELNPDAEAIARAMDAERRAGRVRGPLHGIPVLLKDNVDTGDRMATTAGSLALLDSPAAADATAAARLRRAGAVLLGKTNLSEWANFRSSRSTSGWSARGGLTRNPHALDRNPSGSSSGSAAAVAAGLCPLAVGTETDGSIVSPAGACGVVGLKPTVGRTSRAGVVPIAHSQDSVGALARSVADAAALFAALAGPDARDPATAGAPSALPADHRSWLDRDGLRGARLGVARRGLFGHSPHADAVALEAIRAMRDAGAEIVDPADLPSMESLEGDRSEFEVLLYEFRADLNAYLAGRPGLPVGDLGGVIAFNTRHADREMPFFGQETLLRAQAKGPLEDAGYVAALERSRRLAGPEGIDAALTRHGLDALVAPTGAPAGLTDLVHGDRSLGGTSSPAARAGYPLITVPAGFRFGLPLGVTFMGPAWSEPTLIRLAFAFEQATRAWRPPRFLPTAELRAHG